MNMPSQPTNALLQVDGLCVDIQQGEHTRQVVRNVSFNVQRGKTLCIVGESGCGKSLTALSLLGLLPPTASRRVQHMSFAGINLQTLSRKALADLRGSRLAMIFQDPMTSLNPVFTVGTLLTDVLRRHQSVSHAEARARATFLLERVGINNPEVRLKQYPFELSGGLRQRVMIAMALMCGPELLIADEPTTALDVTVQAELLELLQDIQREFGLGMVFISHDLGLVSKIADDVVVMYAGDIVESGAAQELLSAPRHPYTQMLLRCIPRPGSTTAKSALPSIQGTVPALDQLMVGCAFADRCPHVEAMCRQPFPAAQHGAHRYLCVRGDSLNAATPPAKESA